MGTEGIATHREAWNKGKIVGQKVPFKPKDIWALRVRLQMENHVRELALFNPGIDSKLRGSRSFDGCIGLRNRPPVTPAVSDLVAPRLPVGPAHRHLEKAPRRRTVAGTSSPPAPSP
jgi:hypothetical protein